jgi:hypothetical protein
MHYGQHLQLASCAEVLLVAVTSAKAEWQQQYTTHVFLVNS